jgi:hypothetical protein
MCPPVKSESRIERENAYGLPMMRNIGLATRVAAGNESCTHPSIQVRALYHIGMEKRGGSFYQGARFVT